MKLFMAILGCVFSASAFAQNVDYDIERYHKEMGCSYNELMPKTGYIAVRGSLDVQTRDVLGAEGKVVRQDRIFTVKGDVLSNTTDVIAEKATAGFKRGVQVIPLQWKTPTSEMFSAVNAESCASGTFIIQTSGSAAGGDGFMQPFRCNEATYVAPRLISATCDNTH